MSVTASSQKLRIIVETLSISSNDFLTLFGQFADTDRALLFDSADAGARGGRYSIALWQPTSKVESRGSECWLTQEGVTTKADDLPLDEAYRLMRQQINNIDIDSTDAYKDLPFLVGMAGICGYDLGRIYETLPSQGDNDYLCPDMSLAFYPHSLVFDHLHQQAYYCRLSSLPSVDWQHLLNKTMVDSHPFVLCEPWRSNMSKNQYCAAINRIHHYLYSGDCYQINFAQRFESAYQGNAWQAYKRLRHHNQSPFASYMRVGDSYIMSLSPERFLSCKENNIETKPIKGTRPRSNDPALDQQIAETLLNADKDRAENLMIVDLLRNDLSKHCLPHSVKVPHLFALESYDAVHHMVSTVVGKLNPDSNPFSLFSGAFPGGSITGAPKLRAMEIIEELEPHQRNVYCGSMLYLGIREDMDSSICIRTLLAEKGKIYCWAGGGIVMDSIAESEYQETFDKVANILPILGELDAH